MRTTRTKAHVYGDIRYVTSEVTDGFRTAVYSEDIADGEALPLAVERAARRARQNAHSMLSVLQAVDADA